MSRIELPDGWAQFRDPKKVPERLRRPILAFSAEAAIDAGELEGDEKEIARKLGPAKLAKLREMTDLLVAALVESWSFGDAVTAETVLDLPGDAYDALEKAVLPLLGPLLGEEFREAPVPGSPPTPSRS